MLSNWVNELWGVKLKNHDDKQDEDQRKTNEIHVASPKKEKVALFLAIFQFP